MLCSKLGHQATVLGAKGDGVSDDWAALQAAVDQHPVVYLPKGFYRMSQPLVMRKDGGALVGVGRTLCHLMPLSDPDRAPPRRPTPVLDVVAKGVTIGMLTVVTWDHLPGFAVSWSGTGIWRQTFYNRVQESSFPPFGRAVDPLRPALHPGTPFGIPLMHMRGGGAFYDLNLDFGCCFGTALPPPSVPVQPDTASSGEVWLQLPSYRSLLVNGSTAGVRFYPLNLEQDFGEAHTEIRYSFNVTAYGAKSENNYVVVWIRDSDLVTVHGYGGNASPFRNKTARHFPAQFPPF